MNVPNSEFGADSNRSSSYSAALKQSPSDSLTPQSAAPLREATQIALQVPLEEDETKELLLCALYIFKNLEQGKYSLYSQRGGGVGVGGEGGYFGCFLLGMCGWPLRAPTPL